MKKILYIFLVAITLLASCQKPEMSTLQDSANEAPAKVTLTFPVAIPTDGPATKAMANQPDVKNIFVAVFGGSGYFNEWVPAEVLPAENPPTEYATQNEVIYNLKVKLTVSPSRLNLHIIANSPLTEPPITGVSSNDLESVVMSKVRSHIDNEPNDAYWAKIVLPFGVQDSTIVTNGVEQPYLVNGERYPTLLTQGQFAHWSPIPLVRNFARIKVKKAASLGSDVQISHIGLAYAPAEGTVAPILPNSYTSDQWGTYINIPDGDNTTTFWNENFYIPYSSKTLDNISAAPYNYKGYTPSDVELFNPSSVDDMTAWTPETSDNTYLYLYERAKPRPGQKNTRVLIRAKNGSEAWKFYPLDITDSNGDLEVFLRNYTYTVVIKSLAAGTGEATIAEAVDATGADISSDIRAADLTEVSDGIALIATSYIDTTAIKQGVYSVMYRFVPEIDATGVKENNNPSSTSNPVGVSLQVGYNNGVDGFVANTTSANGSAFSVAPAIELNGDGTAKLYVRSGNGWAVATAANGLNDNSVEKWSRINYTTATKDIRNADAIDADGYYTKGFTQTIRVIGTKPASKGGGQVYRDVQINLTPRKTMIVECLDKYIEETAGVAETVRIYIPDDLTRSMFPMEFKLQPEATTLTPRDGDNLPVQSGKSIIPGKTTQSAFFFIKTLTRQSYLDLPSVTINGHVYKYFDCKFKSTRAVSATTVYAQNEYFNIANDDFFNYTKRLFTVTTSLGDISPEQEKTFVFRMDQAHTGTAVWNDATDITENSRIIPKVVTITLTGVQPQVKEDGTLFDDGLVKGSGTGVYYYYVPAQSGGTPYNDNSVTLHLVGGNADSYSIVLSTSQITPNPNLYESLTVTGDIIKNTLTGGFTNSAGTITATSVEKSAGADVYFTLEYSGEPQQVSFTLTGLTPVAGQGITTAGGQYVYTPTGTGRTKILHFTTTDANTTCVLDNLTVLSEDYYSPNPASFSLIRRSWRTGSYTITIDNNNYTTSSFTTQPQNVVFNQYTTGGGNNNNRYKVMGNRIERGYILTYYVYYDGAFTVTAPDYEGAKISSITMSYQTQNGTTYNTRTVTVNGDESGSSTLTGNKSSWSSSQTGVGNGDSSVTITMQCSDGNDYNNRNRLKSLTVNYGYWD